MPMPRAKSKMTAASKSAQDVKSSTTAERTASAIIGGRVIRGSAMVTTGSKGFFPSSEHIHGAGREGFIFTSNLFVALSQRWPAIFS